MARHSAETVIKAPAHQVYQLFSHFNDFPKFMSAIREVTYYDAQRSHWVADILGRHEWDAVNENWIEDGQIGWKSIDGLENSGTVRFTEIEDNKTRVEVAIDIDPPGGWVGDAAEKLGAGKLFERTLQHDLDNFAELVAGAPPGALDPQSSSYLFNEESAATQGKTTPAQEATMSEPGY